MGHLATISNHDRFPPPSQKVLTTQLQSSNGSPRPSYDCILSAWQLAYIYYCLQHPMVTKPQFTFLPKTATSNLGGGGGNHNICFMAAKFALEWRYSLYDHCVHLTTAVFAQ
uniref:Uncharacterized protein n=1 Tax=Micrurus corallinus TaxID=54390 RepID=A0A2D4F1M6_MICCO